MQFDLPKEKTSIIKVIGVGGGGSNAVNYMFNQGIKGVNFVVANTDAQALELSPIPNKIQMGPSLTEGRGAGSKPEVGRDAMEESMEDMKRVLEVNTKMVFITAGMGGGTGTGGAPVLAKLCRDMGILTVGIVTIPFNFEGRRRSEQAIDGLEELKKNVDTILVISNDKLREVHGNLKLSEAFSQADGILATAARGIAEIITVPGYVNVDFEDVKTVMKESGVAIMGSAQAEGKHRALRAVEAALNSPLLNDNDISGARNILLNISSGSEEVLMDEITEITEFVQHQAGNNTEIIWGNCTDDSLGEKLSVTVIATGFEADQQQKKNQAKKREKVVHKLEGKHEREEQGKPEEPKNAEPKDDDLTPRLLNEEEEEQGENQFTFNFDVWQENAMKDAAGEEVEDEAQEDTSFQLHHAKKDDKGKGNDEDDAPAFHAEETEESEKINNDHSNAGVTHEEREKRVAQLRKLSMKFQNPDVVKQLEEEPAYKRREVELDNTPHSSDHEISRLSLSDKENDEDDDKWELRKNNSFLHDSVD